MNYQQSFVLLLFCGFLLLSLGSCRKGPYCPAYDTVHTNKSSPLNPNNQSASKKDNKKDVEKRKKDELSPKRSRRKKPHTLFPKGMR